MRWFRIPKEQTGVPGEGTYPDWKPVLAEEGRHQCVYCAISESSFGGIRNFHVEHFRPKSKYAELTNSFRNLLYACAICNVFKGNDWPAEHVQDHSIASYPDPTLYDYNDILIFDPASGLLNAHVRAGRYVIERLYLNRPQLILERRTGRIFQRLNDSADALQAMYKQLPPTQQERVAEALYSISKIFLSLRETTPYTAEDVQRPNKND